MISLTYGIGNKKVTNKLIKQKQIHRYSQRNGKGGGEKSELGKGGEIYAKERTRLLMVSMQ